MQLNGVLVPIVTPFDEQGELNVQALRELVAHFLEAGVGGIAACGTTGEYYALSEAERETVLRTVRESIGDNALAIAGINDLSTAGVIRRAEQAKAMGYQLLMLAPPVYSLPGQREVLAYYREIASATDLPIILYNFPARVGVEIAVETVAELAKIPNIVAIKESSGDFSRALALLQLSDPGFQVVCGCDDQAADFLFWGVRAWISGAANVFPAEQARMIAAAEAEDWSRVRAMMRAMLPAIQDMESGDYNQKAKLGCSRHDIAVGDVRGPLQPLEAAAAATFLDSLKRFASNA